MKILLALVMSGFCASAVAQGMYKCKDAAGKITYASNECQMLGLTPAGDVKGRANVAPAPPTPMIRPEPLPEPPAVAGPSAAVPAAAAEKEERRCFVVKTAKGTATRCNDDPEKKED